MRIKNPTFGSDIEFFLKTVRGEMFPAIGIVGGSKTQPKSLGQGYYIQEDNVAVEFNIPVCKSTKEFVKAVGNGYQKCVNQLPPTLQPAYDASAEFADEYLYSPQAREFGCEPDMSAWTRDFNPRPKSNNTNLRSAGGHVHIGWENPDMETRFDLIKACDVFVGLPSIMEDFDTRRRELYGKAGAMRIKPYGVEHRLLSNYWLFDHNNTQRVINRYQQAIDFINYGHKVEEAEAEDIVNTINKTQLGTAKKLLRKYADILNKDKLNDPF